MGTNLKSTEPVATVAQHLCKEGHMGADPEQVGLAAMQGVEWPQHVDLGVLPEGAQWRFADTQEPGAMQVPRPANTSLLL